MVACAKGVRVAARKSGPMGSPGGPVAGETAEATAKLKVAPLPSTICPPPKVTDPVTFMVAAENGIPPKPGMDAKAVPNNEASTYKVPLASVTLAAVGAGAPEGVIT
jgi:hypothetical protein